MTRTRPLAEAPAESTDHLMRWYRSTVHIPATMGGLHPRVIPALFMLGPAAHVEVSLCVGDGDYAGHLISWWAFEDELTIVEHDVEVPPGALLEFARCPEPWCCFPYGSEALLGCTRFRPQELPVIPFNELAGIHWQALDMALYNMLRAKGCRPHRHEPAPVHNHGWQEAMGGWDAARPLG